MQRRKTSLTHRARAFTLVEVVFAIFLTGIGAAIVASTLPIANVSRARADMQNKAVGLAQKEMEAIRGLGYANATPSQLFSYGLIDSTTPVGTNTYSFTNVDSASKDNPALILPGCTGRVNVQQTDVDLKQVIVTVQWNERGTTRSITIGTLIANL